ncbi:hypothetical protein GW17_00011807 [Ensete ventricosum]|nr:hypothetical protein GW17_00011807 [Ensete ventricosum]
MCPLRVVLIFLSATLAGFFALRNLRAETELNEEQQEEESPKPQLAFFTKVGSALGTVFWSFLDMASGRYLWRTLMAPPATGEKKIC